MNGDAGDAPTLAPSTTTTAAATPVRRSARTRKPNSRFADDEVGGCFKKIVSGIGSPEATAPAPSPTLTPGRPRKATGRRKDSRSDDRSDEGEERGERGRKDSREEEKSEELEERSERGRKLSEEAEEKSEKRRKEEVVEEERSEVVKKPKQNEEQVESVEEKDERRKENRSEDVEEKQERRRKLSESEKEEKRRRDSQSEEREEKPPTNSLHNGLEEVEEFVRITRSGRREEDPRRKPIRKRGKGKDDEREENEGVADNPKIAPSEDKSRDSPAGKISKPATQEGSRAVEESPHTPSEPAKKTDSEKGNSDKECVQSPSVGLGVKGVREGADKNTDSPMDVDPPPHLQKKEDEENPSSQRDTMHRRLQGQVVTVSLTRLTRMNSTAASTPPTTSTTATTTTTPAVSTVTSTTTPTTTSVATTTAPAITTSTTTTKITTITSHPRQPAPKLIPPQAPAEPPPDPRLNRGQRSNLVTLVGGPASPRAPSTQGNDPSGTSPPSIPPPSPATRGKEGVVLAPGSGQDAKDSARGCEKGASSPQKVKSASVMENIPLPSASLASMPSAPSASPSSPRHSRQEEEALRKAGGKRERSEKEDSPAKPIKPKEEKEPEITSPQAKKRKEDQKEEETREESKQEETKKRLGDAKEEDQRKRRKVEEEEEEVERHGTPTPTSQRETPHCPTLADIHMPPEPPPAPATPVPPPVPPLPKKPPVTPQDSPRSKKDAVLSPRVEREVPREKESPTHNRDSQRSGNPTRPLEKETPREIKDSRDEKDAGKEPLKDNTNSLRSVEREKSEEAVEQRSLSEKDAREDSGNGGDKDEIEGKEEVTRGDRDTVKSKETIKSDNKDQSKTETRDKSSERDAVRGRTEAATVDREAGRGRSERERETNRSTRDQTRKRDDQVRDREVNRSEKEESHQGEREKNKSKRDSSKEEKDEKESVSKRTQITNLLDIPMPSDTPPTPPTPPTTITTHNTNTQDTLTSKGLFSHNAEDQGGLGSFLGFSSSSTTIPFLEDTASPASECEIPGLSIIASSSPKTNAPKKPAKDDQSHRSWFAFRGGRRSQTNGQSETQSNGSDKENKSKEEEEEESKEDEIQEIHMEEITKAEPMDLEEEEEEEEEKEKEMEVKEEKEDKEEEKAKTEVVEEKEEVKKEEEVEEVDEEQLRKEAEERVARNRAVVEERLRSFTHLEENVYICERKRSKRNKEVRRMVCDCSLTKEEVARGEVGCGEDCLNRLLMIECGSRCPLTDRCTNKRFLNRQYGDVEVFNADEKGCGLRARSDLPPGTFIMEYVGEVFDTREFKRRRKEYARDMRAHFYFMALKSDQLIDATRMGNISRFINHSCDPNAETQKWTVNGDLRIGFFSKKHIEAGEEINFDYRLERYGREPQKCYCGTAICRGWLGESPDEQTKEEKDEARRKEERDRRKREERRAYFEDIDLEDEIEKLNSHKLRNRQDTLNLSRLMVRAEDFSSRVMLLQLLQTGEPACRRLFLDYHGLKVLWSWMADLGLSRQHTALKVEILKTLEVLPITNKTQLTDSRVLSLVERWSGQGGCTRSSTSSTSLSPPPPPPPPPKTSEAALPPPAPNLPATPASAAEMDPSNKKSSDTSEESDSETEPKLPIEGSSADDSSMDSEVDNPKTGMEEESSDSNDAKDTAAAASLIPGAEEKLRAEGLSDEEKEVQELLELHKSMVELAQKLLDAWKNLKEFFRIPKKERIELMKEHEREVDRGYKEYLDQASESDRDSERDRDRRDKDRYNRRDHHYDRRRRSPDREKDRYSRVRGSSREDRSSDSPKMSKEQRRQLFELKVQQQEEEAKQRKMQEEMWTMHVDRCRLLGHDPYLTPIFDPTYQYFWDPVAANWQPYTGSVCVLPDPNLPVPAAYGLNKGEGDGSPMTLVMAGAQGCRLGGAGELPGLGQGGPDDPLNPANIPLPGEVPMLPPGSPSQGVDGTPPHAAKLMSIPLPGEPATVGLEGVPGLGGEGAEVPSAITIHLPARWRVARDADGHVYFYHVKTRITQWEPPTILTPGLASDSSSSSSSSSDSDSSSTTDSEDFSTEEEEEEEAAEEVETVERSEVSNEKMIRHPKNSKRRRSEALVQERVISPILEIDKEAARRERREAKERAREEARQERQEERNTRTQKEEKTQQTTDQQQTEEEVVVAVPGERERERERDRERERERRAERHEARAKREKVKSKERAATAIADNSDAARKIKDTFRSKMATFIVSVLNPYRRGDCREGKITCTEDFKYLARKLTHFVMVKELKQLHSIEALECSDSVKHKTRDFVRKYMSKYGSVFKRDPNDTKEY
ncbi:histone-lysine N-methyltransferase SETD2-like isoform X3 [Eriocheir sinensis]|uniref:histone-lysine N-methyltransferase SETD2-like isoform X3 n=1 Tax=Eriocheir sinensis TaxID=95602 RepID=UPI0021C88F20|nr:histone-lysine N-methyltransferase SETD2-like isoform X3 [Eriocheir sinensis]